jgi:hypothetical protein
MADFKVLKDQALCDISFYGNVCDLSLSIERGGDSEIYIAAVLTLLPSALRGRATDHAVKAALKPVIIKRGEPVEARGRKATCWCEWAANARELALAVLRAALSTATATNGSLSVRELVLRKLSNLNDEPLLVLTNNDPWPVLKQLMPFLPVARAELMPYIDCQSIINEIEVEILSAEGSEFSSDDEAPELTVDEARAKFCFEQWQACKSYKEINAALKRHPEWEDFEDDRAVRGPISAWAQRIGVKPRRGQPGRRAK